MQASMQGEEGEEGGFLAALGKIGVGKLLWDWERKLFLVFIRVARGAIVFDRDVEGIMVNIRPKKDKAIGVFF